jgi:hypothetical protein
VKPGKKALDPPAPSVTAQRAAVLGNSAIAAIGRDHFDSVLFFKVRIELVGIIGLVANEPRRQLVKEAARQRILYDLAFRRRSAVNRNGEWKTVTSGDSDDFRALAAPRGANGKAPFFALAKVASTNASSRLSCPLSCRCRASARNAPSNLPLRTHAWNRRWQVW